MIGLTISHYQLVERVGEGGMGVVYKARDTSLDRFVAIKALSALKTADPEARRRFFQEAKVASSLNHPNIVTIHEFVREGDLDYIVMEFVTGRTLSQLMAAKAPTLKETLRIAIQLADALATAHAAGIVHRDLKPANLIVTDQGLLKILDFGIAKLTARESSDQETATHHPMTQEGMVLGTCPYMSPEQAEGKTLDARSDIFSFGSVLYEMVTGERAFRGGSTLSVLGAVVNQEPRPVREIRADVPEPVDSVIVHCMRKDPAKRFQRIGDVKTLLEEVQGASESARLISAPAPKRSKRGLVLAGAVTAAIALGAAFWMWNTREPPALPEPLREPVPLTTYAGWESDPSFSPDGSQFVFSWDGEKQENVDIYVQLIGSSRPVRLTSDPLPDIRPAWSPDGKWVAFLRGAAPAVDLRLIPPLGGAEVMVAQLAGPAKVAWTSDSRWLVISGRMAPQEPSSISLLSLDGADRKRLTSPAGNTAGDYSPAISPDGLKLAFVKEQAVMMMPLSEGYQPKGQPRRLFSGNPVDVAAVAWTPDGRDLVLSGTTGGSDWSLWRVPADGSVAPQRLSAGGTAGKSFAISRPAASGAARLAYTREIFDSNVWRARLDTSGKAGTPERLIASTRNDTTPQYSPDGNKIAFSSTRSGAFEIWVANADGTSPVQLTSAGKYSATPRWSPDGAWIAFDSNAEGQWDVYVVAAAGGRPRRLTDNPARDAVPSWSRDGKWIYFSSDRTGDNQIWKVPPAGGQQVQVTSAGGHVPFESVDGKTLYYTKEYDLHPSLWSVPVEGGQETRVLESVSWRGFAPRKDGIWFLRWYGAERVTRIHFYSFAGGPLKTATEIDSWAGNGLSVSPDGRTLLFTCRETAGADLMLIDPFR